MLEPWNIIVVASMPVVTYVIGYFHGKINNSSPNTSSANDKNLDK